MIFNKSFPSGCISFFMLFISMNMYAQSSPPFTCSDTAYIFQGIPTGMYAVKFATGNTILLKEKLIQNAPNRALNAFGYNQTDNYIWGYRYNTNELVKVAADYSVKIYPIAGLPADKDFNVGDIDDNGILYLTHSNDTLVYRINLNPASRKYLQLLQNLYITPTPIADWTFSPVDKNIYALSSSHTLYRFNSVTGVRTFLGQATGADIQNVSGTIGAAFMDGSGNLYVSDNISGKLFRIATPHSGNTAAMLIAQGPMSGFNDGALCRTAVLPFIASTRLTENPGVNIHYNPAVNELTFKTDSAEPSEIILYDMMSRKIFQQNFFNSVTINTGEFAKGIYLFQILNNHGLIKQDKVIIK